MGAMDRVRAVFGMRPRTFDERPAARFAEAPLLPVDQLLSYMYRRSGTVDRARALTVPAVLKGRNIICSIGTLPLEAVDVQHRVRPRALFRQLDANVPNVVVMAQTLEDLLFDAVAWWRVVGFDADGYPSRVQRYAPDQVSLQPPASYQRGYLPSGLPTEGVVWMEGRPVPFAEVIRFDSPNPGLLVAGAPSVRRALAAHDTAELYAKYPRRRGYFRPVDNVDPAPDEEIEKMLEDWAQGSIDHVDGYVPAAMEYTSIQDSTPAELQLMQMIERATIDLANILGLTAEDLGASVTSRTYQNATDRRQDRVNEALAPYIRAITDRLSMPDVTRDGESVRLNLGDYLKADPKTRAEVQQIYASMGATDGPEVRDMEGLPPRTIQTPAAATGLPVDGPRRVPSTVGDPVAVTADDRPALTFDREVGLTFDGGTVGFAVDDQTRTVTGLLVPWGQVARSNGRRWRFARGSLKYSAVNRVKLLRDHDNKMAVGVATRIWEDDRGLWGTFRVSAGPRGDEALTLAADGVLDGLSVGVDMREEDISPDPLNPGGNLVAQAALRETSMTAVPSFDDSRLVSVRASRNGEPVDCPTCGKPIVDGVAHTCPTPAAAPPAAPVTFSAEQFATFLETVRGSGEPATPAPEPRPVVDPTQTPAGPAAVTEALPYRFSFDSGKTTFSAGAEHDFSSDLISVLKLASEHRDYSDPLGRVNSLIRAAFADVERADVTALNPNQHRPDMWVRQRDYRTVLWDMIAAGTTDGRKFDVPKFNSSSGLVVPATEKVEPAPGAFVAELQTITPTQVWGKVEITRQAWRDGGSPQLSGILWDQMLREYYEDREAAVATFLNTLTAAADIALTGTPATTPDNDDDQVTVSQLEAAIAMLQFDRGGDQISAFAVHRDLYKVLARVTDDAGRPLYPIINPANANGSATPRFRTMDVAGVTAVGSYALGASGTASANSWLFDPATVFGWASAPERLFWDFGATVQTANIPQLSFVTLGIYGDIALANTDINGVRQVTFDPSV